jgi:hypothetical protein
MGAAGARHAAEFGPDALVPRVEAAYELALEKRRAKTSSPGQ